MRICGVFYGFFTISLINSIVQEQKFRFHFHYDTKMTLKFNFLALKYSNYAIYKRHFYERLC